MHKPSKSSFFPRWYAFVAGYAFAAFLATAPDPTAIFPGIVCALFAFGAICLD